MTSARFEIPEPPKGASAAPAATRNAEPIFRVLKAHLPARGRLLEIAAGGGLHAAAFARALPGLEWTPSDPDPAARASLAAWRRAGPANLRAALGLDVLNQASWPQGPFDAILCVNMIHISPWEATPALMTLAGRTLAPAGLLILYGPYREAETPLAASNAAFDADLKARDARWGLRDRAEVEAAARAQGLALTLRRPMPANNLTLLFRRI